MMIRVLFWAFIATCILGWWIPLVNTGLRYATILIFIGYTGIAAVLALRNAVFRRMAALCGGCSIGLVFAPAWLIPVVALPVIVLTAAYLDIGAQIIPHYVRHGHLPDQQAEQVEQDGQRRGRPDDTAPPPRRHPESRAQHQQHSRRMEPDLDTDSLRNEIWR